MLRRPKDKKELIKHLQQLRRDFKVIAIGWGRKSDVLEEIQKLSPTKEAAAIVFEFR